MTIVVNTPTGNIGRRVTAELLSAREQVVILGRHPSKVADLVERGARFVQGSMDDRQALEIAMQGAEAVFWLTPFAFDQPDYLPWARRTAQTAAEVAERQGVQRAVLISSVGAQEPRGAGPIGCLPAIEEAFRRAVPNVRTLRAGSFMENYLQHVGTLAASGTIFSPYPATKKIPLVATRDIAAKAVEQLRDRGWSGYRAVGVHGPEDLDQTEAAQIIGEGLGHPVRYVEVTVDEARQAMREAGLPGFAVELLGDMYTGLREGRMERAEARTAETTTRTSLLEFVRQVVKPAVEAQRSP